MTTQKRKSRYDVDDAPAAPSAEPAPNMPWEASTGPSEARRVLEAARLDMERVVLGEMRRLEATLAAKADHVAAKLTATLVEIERLQRETNALRANRYDEVLKQLRERMNGL